MVNKKTDAEDDFMTALEKGVRDVLAKKGSTASERLAAVNAGTKLLAIRHKILGDDTENFFTK